jgi:hypothetical protein
MKLAGSILGKSAQVKAGIIGFINVLKCFDDAYGITYKLNLTDTTYDIEISDDDAMKLLKFYYDVKWVKDGKGKGKFVFSNSFLPDGNVKGKNCKDSYSRLRMAVHHGGTLKKGYSDDILDCDIKKKLYTEDDLKRIINFNIDLDSKKEIKKKLEFRKGIKNNISLGAFKHNGDGGSVTIKPDDYFFSHFSMVGSYLFLMHGDMVICIPNTVNIKKSCDSLDILEENTVFFTTVENSFSKIFCPQESIIKTGKTISKILNGKDDFSKNDFVDGYEFYSLSNAQVGYSINVSGRSNLDILIPSQKDENNYEIIQGLNDFNVKRHLLADFFKRKNLVDSLLFIVYNLKGPNENSKGAFNIKYPKCRESIATAIDGFVMTKNVDYKKDLETLIRGKICAKIGSNLKNKNYWDKFQKIANGYLIRLRSIRSKNAFVTFFHSIGPSNNAKIPRKSMEAILYDLNHDYKKLRLILIDVILTINNSYKEKDESKEEGAQIDEQ